MVRKYILHRHSAPAGPRIDYAAELNEQQYAAVTAPPGPAGIAAYFNSAK